MSDDEDISFDIERQDVGDDADAEPRRYARSQVAPLRCRAEDCGAIPAGRYAICGRGSRDFGTVVAECGVFDGDYYVSAVLSQLRGFRSDSRWSDHESVDFASAQPVGELAGGSYSFESDLSHFPATRFDKRKDVRHQRTFASVWRSFTSSGTAAAPSPTIRPAFRSGGSSSLRIFT